MTDRCLVQDVQIWSPGLNAEPLISGLRAAGLSLVELKSLDDAHPIFPVLVVYADPLVWVRQRDILQIEESTESVFKTLPFLSRPPWPCRLVNAGCLRISTLVSWCFEAGSVSPSGLNWSFFDPQPLEAVLALEIMRCYPRLERYYLSIEEHPLAAIQDHRPVDYNFIERYRDASAQESLMTALADQDICRREIALLSRRIGYQKLDHASPLALREQIHQLCLHFAELESIRQYCTQLQHSHRIAYEDLEVLSRRVALMEDLLGAATAASMSMQFRLAQATGC